MKAKFFILTATCLLLIFGPVRAQLPGIDLQFAGDSTWYNGCSVGDTSEFMVYGTAGGYPAGDSVFVEVFFGDGTDTSFYALIIQNYYFYASGLLHIYQLPGNYSVMFIATGSDGSTDTIIDNSVLISTSCGDISGVVYVDANSDCIYNAGEITLNQVHVKAEYAGSVIAQTFTDAQGAYFLMVPSGFTYDVSISSPGLSVSCPVSGVYTVSTFPANGLNFGVACSSQFDLTGGIWGQGFRVNNTTSFHVSAINQVLSCAPPNSSVTVTLDPLLSYVSSSIVPSSINGQQLTFNSGTLNANITNWSTSVTVLTLPGASIGDTLCITMEVTPLSGDANQANNTVVKCMPVRNSCDPNEKYEVLAGATSAGILPGTGLDYTIMFQNLGNDDAYDIYIIDTLDASLDNSSFRLTSFSHTPVVRMISNNILKFEFKNINLPAASVNEPLSHGFVSYSISALPGLTHGTTIENTAHIYFDFNAAVITNTVSHIIDLSSGVPAFGSPDAFTVYPNPATDYITIVPQGKGNTTITIKDATGKLMGSHIISETTSLSTSNWPGGIYFIELTRENQTRTGKIIVR